MEPENPDKLFETPSGRVIRRTSAEYDATRLKLTSVEGNRVTYGACEDMYDCPQCGATVIAAEGECRNPECRRSKNVETPKRTWTVTRPESNLTKQSQVTAHDCGIIEGCLTFWDSWPPETGTLVRAFAPGDWRDVHIEPRREQHG